MKILHVVSYFPPDGMGGVGQGLARLHAGLLARGHHSRVLTAGTTESDPAVLRIARTPAGFLAALARQASVVRNFDIVHCRHGDALPLLLAVRCLGVRTPVLATFHVHHRGMGESYRPYRICGERFGTDAASRRYRYLVARFHRTTDWLTRQMATSCSFISRFGAIEHLGEERGARATVIYNAVPDWNDEPDGRAPLPLEMLYVGSFSHRKRTLALPFILREVRRSVPGARLRLIGAARTDQTRLAALFDRLALSEAVCWQGQLSSDAIRPYYRRAVVLVVPSAYEGLPTVILEAFRCGLPCVATKVAAHAEVIDDGGNGFLVRPDDPAEMAARCVEILTESEKRHRMGRAARETVLDRFTLERQVREYESLYERVCRCRGGAALSGNKASCM